MRKSVTISEKEYELVTNAYTPIAYKSEFGKDFFQDLFGMISNQNIMRMATMRLTSTCWLILT